MAQKAAKCGRSVEVTSLPAANAVWAFAKRSVFFLYIALALTGSLVSGILFQAWVGV